jgi:large conductance mechanosensitive channel
MSQQQDQVGNKEIAEKLDKIITLLTPPATPTPKGFSQEFIAFLKQYKILGLAVAFVFAIYLGALVLALVKDFIMPVVGLALGASGGGQIQNEFIGIFGVGDFLIALITFIIVALVIFLIVKMSQRWHIE